MPYETFYKPVVAPVLGVDFHTEPQVLSPRAWRTLTQYRCHLNVVSNFPGWATILASGGTEGFCSLIKEFLRQDGSSSVVIGGPTKLFSYIAGTQTLTDISGAITFGPTRDYPWSADVFNDVLYLTNKIDGLHKWTGSGNVANIATGPDGWFLKVFREHICTFGDGANGMRFRWAAEASETDWTASATNDAGQFDFIDTPDQATGLEFLHDELIAYKRRSIHAIGYVGGNEVFGRRRVSSHTGLVGPYALIPFRDRHIGMGERFFFEYAGGNVVNDEIGLPIHDGVYNTLHPTLRNRSRALLFPQEHEILFAYPDISAVAGCNKAVLYNYVSGVWHGPFTFPVEVSMFGTVASGLSVVIDDVDDIIDTVSTIINAYPATAGTALYLLATEDGNVHSISENFQSANGTAITREAESGDILLSQEAVDSYGRQISFPLSTIFRISGVDLDFLNIANENIELRLGTRMDLNDNITWSSPVSVKSFSTQKPFIPFLQTGRWARIRLLAPNSARMKLAGYQFRFSAMGVR